MTADEKLLASAAMKIAAALEENALAADDPREGARLLGLAGHVRSQTSAIADLGKLAATTARIAKDMEALEIRPLTPEEIEFAADIAATIQRQRARMAEQDEQALREIASLRRGPPCR